MSQPTEPLSCRYGHLVEVLAAIDQVLLADELPACDEPAAWATYVRRKRDGQDADTYTRTCDGHDQQFHAVEGYVKSIRLSVPKPGPST